MSTSNPSHMSSTAFQLRLNLLESLLSGSPSSSNLTPIDDETAKASETKDVQTRTTSLEEDFQSLISGGSTAFPGVENIRRFVDRFESIQTLLKTLPPAITSPASNDSSVTTPAVTDMTPTAYKLPHILSIHPDLLETTHLLTQLQVLADQDISGSGSLVQGYALNQSELTQARLSDVQRVLVDRGQGHQGGQGVEEDQAEDKLRVTQGENLRRMVGLLSRWDEFTKHCSQIFLNLHETMTDLERAVERVERARTTGLSGQLGRMERR